MKLRTSKRLMAILMGAMLFPTIGYGQVEVKWDKTFTGNILWQEVTSLGNLIVCSDNGLMGVNTGTGAVVWTKKELANIPKDEYHELPNSPFFTIETNKVISMIDQFSGAEVFNSAKAGIADIKNYFLLYQSDAILVAGKDNAGKPLMLCVKMSNGSVSWKMNEKFGRIIAAQDLGNNQLLIVTLFNNYKINAGSGNIIWKKANSKEAEQLNKMGGFGSLMKAATEQMSSDKDIQLNFYRKPGRDVFYLGSQQEQQTPAATSSGQPTVTYTNSYNAYKISDGSLVWKNQLEVAGKLSQVAFLKNGLLILPDNGNRTKINLYDYQTHEGLWGKKGRGIAIKGGIYDYLQSEHGILLVSRTTNKDFLNYLDPVAGVITFDKPVKVEGSVVGIVPLSKSILYITTETMNILDPATGTLKWKKSIQTTPDLTAEYNGKIYAFDSKSGILKAVDMNTEEVKDVSSTPLKFQGKETPERIEVMNDGVFVQSDQNVAKIGFDGTIKFNEYFPAPHDAGWKRALLYAEAVRAAYIGVNSYYVAGALASVQNEVSEKDAVAGQVVGVMSNAYGELGDEATGYAASAFKQANARMKATKEGRDFMFIMSKQENGIELLQISKMTGKIEGKIQLGKDREPVYAVDDITGQVYYQTGKKELTSYQVK